MVDIIIKTVQADTGTLASETAVVFDATMADFTEAILLTKCKSEIIGEWPDVANDRLLLVLGYGDASIAKIAAAFTTSTTNPGNAQDYREGQTSVRAIIDFVALKPTINTGGLMRGQSIEWDLPKGGLPAVQGSGFTLFLFNPDTLAALTDGPTLNITTKWIFARMSS